MKRTTTYKGWECKILILKYYSNNPAIQLIDNASWEPIVSATSNFDGLKEDEVALDINNAGIEIFDALKEADVIDANSIEDAIRIIPSGYCEYPVFKLKK